MKREERFARLSFFWNLIDNRHIYVVPQTDKLDS